MSRGYKPANRRLGEQSLSLPARFGLGSLILLLSVATLHAGDHVWTGSWSPGPPDEISDRVIFRSGGDVTWDVTLPLTVGDWIMESGYSGTVTVETVYSGEGVFTNLAVTGDMVISNGVLKSRGHLRLGTGRTYRLAISVGGDLFVGASGHISADLGGFYYAGPDIPFGEYGTAASHGGIGGTGNRTYGSFLEPDTFGGSGDDNGAVIPGGGAVRLIVAGASQINGSITSEGGNWSNSRPASGGSIFLQTATCSGSGTIQASPSIPGGAGGRVAVVVTGGTGAGGVELRANSLGGSAGAGSVYLGDAAGDTVYVDDWGNGGTRHCPVPGTFPGDATYPATIYAPDEDLGGVDFVVTNGGRMQLWESPAVTFGYERYAPLGGVRVEAGAELNLINTSTSWVGELTVNGTNFAANAVYSVTQINAQAGASLVTGDGAVRVGLYLYHSPATNASTSSATIDGFMAAKGPLDPEVFLAWGLGNGGTDTNSWDTLDAFGAVSEAGSLSTNVDGRVTADRIYYFRLFGVNAAQSFWSEPVETFLTGDIWIEDTDTSASEGGDGGTVTLQRPATATNGPLIVHLDIGGTAEPGVDYEAISSVITMQTGQASLPIAITPINDGSIADETVSFTIAPRRGSYGIHHTSTSAVVTISPVPLPAGYNQWNGSDPTVGTNWSLGHVPTNTETVYLSGLASNLVWSSAMPHKVGGWIQTESYLGTVTIETVFPGQGAFSNLHIAGTMVVSNGVIAHKQHAKLGEARIYRLSLIVDGDLVVGPDGHISADLGGFYYAGPDIQSGEFETSASHGGIGGTGNRTYGSFLEPDTFGGSGDDNGAVIPGGGAVRLVVAGASQINGSITSEGGNWSNGRPASGGSIFLQTATCSGSGTIQASPSIPGGAGGRVAVVVTNGTGAGGVELRANSLGGSAGAGSVYLGDAAGDTVYVDDWGNGGTRHCPVPGTFPGDATYSATIYAPDEDFGGVDFVVTNGGRMQLWESPAVTFGYEGYAPLGGVRVEAGAELNLINTSTSWVGELTVNGTNFAANAVYSVTQINAQAGASLVTGDGAVRVGLYLYHSPATNASTSSATIDGFIGAKGPLDPEVYLAWGLSNGGTDTNSWDTLDAFGAVSEAGSLSTNVDGRVTADRIYYFRLFGVNTSFDYWSEPVETFLSGDVWIEGTDTNATESGDGGTVTLHRATSATNGPLTVHLDIAGTAEPGVDYEAISSVITMQTGQASLPIAITPISDGSSSDETVSFTIVHRRGSYGIHAVSNGAAVNIAPVSLPAGFNAWNGSDPTLGTNWSLGHVPTNTETVYLSGLASNLVWSSAMPHTVGGWIQTESYLGTVTVETVFPGQGAFSNLHVAGTMVVSNGVIVHKPHVRRGETQIYRLSLIVDGDLVIGPNGHISADKVGFRYAGPDFGAASPSWSFQASHGGEGSSAGYRTYGSFLEPGTFGSSGDDNGPSLEYLGGRGRENHCRREYTDRRKAVGRRQLGRPVDQPSQFPG